MSEPVRPVDPPESEAVKAERKAAWWRKRWVTIGEVVALAALAIAVLGYIDSHKDRQAEADRRVAESRKEVARAALVLTGEADKDGSRLALSPLGSGQAIQGQRYVFPKAVLGHVMEVSAARPQIDRAWFDGGLKTALESGGGAKTGEGTLPVGVITRYIEDGEERTDISLYRIGYAVRNGGLFAGRQVVLLGLSLARRGVSGDLQAAADKAWEAQPALAGAGG